MTLVFRGILKSYPSKVLPSRTIFLNIIQSDVKQHFANMITLNLSNQVKHFLVKTINCSINANICRQFFGHEILHTIHTPKRCERVIRQQMRVGMDRSLFTFHVEMASPLSLYFSCCSTLRLFHCAAAAAIFIPAPICSCRYIA